MAIKVEDPYVARLRAKTPADLMPVFERAEALRQDGVDADEAFVIMLFEFDRDKMTRFGAVVESNEVGE